MLKKGISKLSNLKNAKNILIFLFMLIAAFSFIGTKELNDLDEVWNYNFARAISEGLIPYKDISMITTPLLPLITSVFLKLITNELMMSRILASLLSAGILYMTFKILMQLIKEENICIIATALIGLLFSDVYCIDYNFTVLFITLIILYQELKNVNKETILKKKYDFVIRCFGWTHYMYKTNCRFNSFFYCNNL